MKATLVKTEDIAVEFAMSTKLKDIEHLSSLLSENGSFAIQDHYGKTIFVNREDFIKWYENELKDAIITDIDYDQCIQCMIGNKVVLFNSGRFPISFTDNSERSKTGLMLDIQEGKIIGLNFCRGLLKTDNKDVFECRGEKIKEYISQGMSVDEAIRKAIDLSPDDLF